jgi:glycosyltransferase involved in cell wall biosynthesis
MVVANDLSIDARVRRVAKTIAGAGPRVTVLGISPSKRREEFSLGEASAVLLPIDEILRSNTDKTPFLAKSDSRILSLQLQVASSGYFNHQRTVGAEIGWLQHEFWQHQSQRLAARRLVANERPTHLLGKVVRKIRLATHLLGGSVLRARFQWTEAFLRIRLKSRYFLFEQGQGQRLKRLATAIAEEEAQSNWRTIHPELHDYDAAFGPELDRLQPDVIHVHDVHLLGVAARSVGRAHIAGNPPKLIYDSHEFVPGLAKSSRHAAIGWASLEREYIHRADRIVTVSKPMAELIAREYGLSSIPDVVMNTPDSGIQTSVSVRKAAGVADSIPLVVYSGGITPERGVRTLVEAIGRLDRAHLVLVTERDRYTLELEELASAAGYLDRVHVLPYVPPDEVAAFLESATIGVSPISSAPLSHRVTLPNKIFEYMHARLPVVVSDCPATADLVRDHGIGEVFASGDTDDLTRTIDHVLRNLATYHASYDRQPELLDRYSWEAQRENLLRIYGEILGDGSLSKRRDELGVPPPTAKGY